MACRWRFLGSTDRHLARRRCRTPHPAPTRFRPVYGIIDGVTHFFSPHYIMEDDRRVEVSPTDYYFTDAITDRAIAMIEEGAAADGPFFLYLAHAAPHWPLHAHEEDIAKYDGIYDKVWDAIRTARHEEMLSRDILQHRWPISPRDEQVQPWTDAKHRDWEPAHGRVCCYDRSDGPVRWPCAADAAASGPARQHADPPSVRQWWLRRVHGRGWLGQVHARHPQ